MTRAYDNYDDEGELQEKIFVDIFGIGACDSSEEDQETQDRENDGPVSHYPCPLSALLSKEAYLESIEAREILEPLPCFYSPSESDTMREEWVRVVRVTAYDNGDTLFLVVKENCKPPCYAMAEVGKDGGFAISQMLSRPPLQTGEYDFGPNPAR